MRSSLSSIQPPASPASRWESPQACRAPMNRLKSKGIGALLCSHSTRAAFDACTYVLRAPPLSSVGPFVSGRTDLKVANGQALPDFLTPDGKAGKPGWTVKIPGLNQENPGSNREKHAATTLLTTEPSRHADKWLSLCVFQKYARAAAKRHIYGGVESHRLVRSHPLW